MLNCWANQGWHLPVLNCWANQGWHLAEREPPHADAPGMISPGRCGFCRTQKRAVKFSRVVRPGPGIRLIASVSM